MESIKILTRVGLATAWHAPPGLLRGFRSATSTGEPGTRSLDRKIFKTIRSDSASANRPAAYPNAPFQPAFKKEKAAARFRIEMFKQSWN
jgi:hypothetical protein